MTKSRLILLLVAIALLGGCHTEVDPDFGTSADIRLEVRGRVVFSFDEATCQLGYDSAAGEFRVHTDNMSDFFIVTLPELPTAEGQAVIGSVRWATASESGHRDDISLEVVRIEGGTIWLWSPVASLGVTVRIL